MSQPGESSVIDRARAGDHRAFAQLVARWDGEVLNLAYRLTGNREDALDIRQEAFTRAYRSLRAFDGRSRFSTWMYRIVVNLVRDHHRRHGARVRRTQAVAARTGGASAPAPDGPARRDEVAAAVAAAIGELTAAQREVLVLRHYHQVPLPDVAAALGVPVTTARSRLHQALAHLRRGLERQHDHLCLEGDEA